MVHHHRYHHVYVYVDATDGSAYGERRIALTQRYSTTCTCTDAYTDTVLRVTLRRRLVSGLSWS